MFAARSAALAEKRAELVEFLSGIELLELTARNMRTRLQLQQQEVDIQAASLVSACFNLEDGRTVEALRQLNIVPVPVAAAEEKKS